MHPHSLTKTLYIPLQKSGADENGAVIGYASVFNMKDDQGDIVDRGAFAGALRRYKTARVLPPMLWMHDMAQPCGVWLKMAEDAVGLAVQGRLNLATKLGREAYKLVKHGAVTGLSIGYRIMKSRYDSARRARILQAVQLDEVSLVVLPANRAARISAVKALVGTRLRETQSMPDKNLYPQETSLPGFITRPRRDTR